MSRGKRHFMSMLGAAGLSAVMLGMPAAALAQDEPAGPNTGKISFSAGIDISDAYYFRGIKQENDGVQLQPYFEMTFNLYEGDGVLQSLGIVLGSWSSFHFDDPPSIRAGGDPSRWYEADIYAGLAMGLADTWSLKMIYTAYMSPNGVFTTVQDVTITVGYDDAAHWEGIVDIDGFAGLQPSAALVVELYNQADGGNGFPGASGTDEGIALLLGIEPSMTLIASEDMPITLSVPVTAGFSLDDYYERVKPSGSVDDDNFGFVEVAVKLSTPLAFIPAEYGEWEVYGSVNFLFLGETTEELNSDDDFEVYFKIGAGFTY